MPDFGGDYSDVVLSREGDILRVFLNSGDQWIFPPDTLPIPHKLERAVLLFEDRRFLGHPGIDPLALGRAILQNVRAGRYVSGASTITMQVVRIAGGRKRTVPNKIIEMLIALKLDLLRSKDDILKMYIVHAPYGGNIMGYTAASWRYWGRPPHELTWAEAATLAVLPNDPSRVNPERDLSPLRAKRDRLLKKIFEYGEIDRETYELALLEDIPEGQLPFPLFAPHFSRRISKEREGVISTTIDLGIQQRLEQITADYGRNIEHFGVENCAALVVETETGRIAAWIGSEDFYSSEAGRVDGVTAPRSYGSLLKPFLYALSFEKGIVHPRTMMRDIPTYYGAFAPANSTRDYRGLVAAEDALKLSLNVPAVRLLYTYGYQDFHEFLRNAGLVHLSPDPEYHGLTLILGGGEATMFELARLFRSLGRLGEYGDIGYLDEEYPTQKRIIGKAAAWQVLEILRDVRRPGVERYWDMYSSSWPFAWKTGTSFGYRDAWAAGVSPDWTVIVWTGNFDGRGNPSIVGAELAGPLLFRIFNDLPKEKEWWGRPESEMTNIALCKETGLLAGRHCPDTIFAYTPVGTHLEHCSYHKKVFLSKDRDEFVCSLCWEEGEPIDSVWLFWPPEVATYLRKCGVEYREPLRHRTSCTAMGGENPINILYPVSGGSIIPSDSTIVGRAAHSMEGMELFWYLDEDFVSTTIDGSGISEHSIELPVTLGQHRLGIVDRDGNRSSILFIISD